MKRIAAWMLVVALLLLSACGQKSAQTGGVSSGAAAIGAEKLKNRKCPGLIMMEGRPLYTLNWQENAVTVTCEDSAQEMFSDAVYDPQVNALRIPMKQSDVSELVWRFDEKGRLTAEFAHGQNGVDIRTSMAYDEQGSLVYGAKWYEEAESGEQEDVTNFSIMLCKDADGYTAQMTDGSLSVPVTEWGDFRISDSRMEYDADGNLLRVTDRGEEVLSYSYTDVPLVPWSSVVMNLLTAAIIIGEGGDGFFGDYPLMMQLASQIPMVCEENVLYAPTDTPDTAGFPYASLLNDGIPSAAEPIESTIQSDIALPTATSAAASPTIVGKYINSGSYSQSCDPEYRPYISLYRDGTCIYYENFYEDCMTFRGTYTVTGDTVRAKVKDGDYTNTIQFTRSGDTLYLQKDAEYGDFGGVSQKGDAFFRSKEVLAVPTKQHFATTAEHVAQILWDHTDVWVPTEDEAGDNGKCCFAELDGDGVPELVLTDMQGSGRYSYNWYYKVDLQTETVSKIPYSGALYAGQTMDYEVSDRMDWYPGGENEMKLYRSEKTGALAWWGVDYERFGASGGRVSEGFLLYENGSVHENYLFCTDESFENETHTMTYSAYGKEEALTQAQYRQAVRQTLDTYTDLHVQYKFVDILDVTNWDVTFAGMNGESVKKMLIESYNAFNYDGYQKQ